MKRVLLFSQKPLGEKCFDILIKKQSHQFKLLGVVSNKSKNVWWNSNYIYQKTLNTQIKFIDNTKKNEDEIYQYIYENKINFLISVQHPWILSSKIIDSVNNNAFNLHNAKLPEFKGNNIFSHVILNNKKTHTSTIHYMAKEVDMGDIVLEREIEIQDDFTSKMLYDKAQINALKLFQKFINLLETQNTFERKRIHEEGTFYNKKSIEKLKEIQNILDFQEVDRKTRAFYFPPFEPAFFIIKNKKYYVLPENAYKK